MMKRSDRVHDFQLINSKRSKSEDGAISARRSEDQLAALTLQLQMEWRLSAPEADQFDSELLPQDAQPQTQMQSPRSSVAPEILAIDAEQVAASPSSKSRFNLRCLIPKSPILGRKGSESGSGVAKPAAKQSDEEMQQNSPATYGKGLLRRNLVATDSFLRSG